MKSAIKAEVRININDTIHDVWEALTNPAIIKKYFFGTDTKTDWKVGSPIIFEGEWQGKKYQDKGTIIAIEPNKFVKYSYWSSMSGIEDKPENYVDITYTLSGIDHNVTVTILQENIPTIEMKEHSEKNWAMVLNDMKKLLETSATHQAWV